MSRVLFKSAFAALFVLSQTPSRFSFSSPGSRVCPTTNKQHGSYRPYCVRVFVCARAWGCPLHVCVTSVHPTCGEHRSCSACGRSAPGLSAVTGLELCFHW